MGIAAKSTLVDDVHFSPGSEYEAIRIICWLCVAFGFHEKVLPWVGSMPFLRYAIQILKSHTFLRKEIHVIFSSSCFLT
jgi:hypothetical protein